MRISRLNFLSITFKLVCCGRKVCVADNFNHNKNITFKFAAAAATLVTDQVVLLLQCSGLTTEASPTLCVHPVIPDSELKMIKVTHISHQDRATPAMCIQ